MPIATKPSDPTAFDVRYGDATVRAADIALRLGVIIAAPVILYYAKKKLGPLVGAFITAPMIQAQLEEARNAGLNAVEGAVHGRILHVEGAPQAVVAGAKHLIDQADVDSLVAWGIRAMGGPDQAAKRIWALLPLPMEATTENSLVPALAEIASHVAALPATKQAALHPPAAKR